MFLNGGGKNRAGHLFPGPYRIGRACATFLKPQGVTLDRTDGLSLEFRKWRGNLRQSHMEPVLRLNVETRQDPDLLREKTAELLALLT